VKEVFKAVHVAELPDFLARIGVAEDFKAGKLRCFACERPMTTENFRAVTRVAGKLVFFCSDESCLQRGTQGGMTNERLPG